MVDLRLYANDLEGKVIKPRKNMSGHDEGEIPKLTREYTIDKVYPYYVIAHTECENGYIFRECFNVGDLVQMGMIDTIRPRYGNAWDYHGGAYDG